MQNSKTGIYEEKKTQKQLLIINLELSKFINNSSNG